MQELYLKFLLTNPIKREEMIAESFVISKRYQYLYPLIHIQPLKYCASIGKWIFVVNKSSRLN